MQKTNTEDVSGPDSKDKLADDVALLYSWAKIENGPYRDFSRRRESHAGTGGNANGQNRQAAVGDRTEDGQKSSTNAAISVGAAGSVAARVDPGDLVVETQQIPQGQRVPTNALFTKEVVPDMGRQPPRVCQLDASNKIPIVVAVYSIAGGVGKTTICANLGKALCSLGEQVLLVDATGRQVLPFYFGATELRAGLRRFTAPGANGSSIEVLAGGEVTTQWLEHDVKPMIAGSQRTIIDLGHVSEGLVRQIMGMCTLVIIPLLPDFNSIVTVSRIEKLLSTKAAGSNSLDVFYMFNQFDERRVNDQRAREYVKHECGNRLLPMSLGSSQELADALEAGLPGQADYTPGSELSQDYLELALWVRRVAPLVSPALTAGRWSEQ